MPDQKKCIECGGSMHAIRVLDQSNLDVHRQLEYSAVDAQKGRWSGRFPVEGHLTAELCDGCGRVVFRAVPSQR